MANSPIDDSQQTAAKVAGFAYLITFATVVYVNFGIHARLIVENNAETARNVLAHERLFRIGIAGDLVYCAGVVVLLTALYVILKPVNRGLALLAAFWRWYERVLEGKSSNQRSLTLHAGLTRRYIGKVFGCAFLAPDIVEAILEGRQPRVECTVHPAFEIVTRHVGPPINRDYGAEPIPFG